MAEYRAKWAFIDRHDKRVSAGSIVTGDAKYLSQLEGKGLIVKRQNKPVAPAKNKAADTSAVENKAPSRRGRPRRAQS